MAADAADDVLLRLPDEHRAAFKDPLGELYTDVSTLLSETSPPIIAVGDVVTATLVAASHEPAVSIVDGHTERVPVSEEVQGYAAEIEPVIEVSNPPATITRSLTQAIVRAIADPDPVRIQVDGEEDLGVIPAVLAAPTGATVLYGQPGEGMVAVQVTDTTVETVSALLGHLEGDHGSFLRLLGRENA